MLVQSIKAIRRKISKSEKKDELMKVLKQKINESDSIKKELEALKTLNSKKKSLTEKKSFDEFKKQLTESKANQVELKNDVTKLLEFFEINPKTILPSKLDNALSLNEKELKKFVVDSDSLQLKEGFKRLLASKDKSELEYNFKTIKFFNECFEGTRKKMISASVAQIEKETDFKKAVEKTYRLRKLVEGLLTEKTISSNIQGVGIFQNIEIKIFNEEKIMIGFTFPATPIAKNTAEWMKNAKAFKSRLEQAETLFINNSISQTDAREYISGEGSIWKIIMQTRVMDNSSLLTTTNVRVKGLFTILKPISGEKSRELAVQMLEMFEQNLLDFLGDKVDYLTPDAQTELVSKLGSVRKWSPERGKGPKKAEKDEFFSVEDFGNYYKY